jgi:hypothetical protein
MGKKYHLQNHIQKETQSQNKKILSKVLKIIFKETIEKKVLTISLIKFTIFEYFFNI